MPLIIATDCTQVTLFGNKTAYPMYGTIGNLPKEIRRKSSRRGQFLLGYLPTSKLKPITNKASRRRMLTNVFHVCVQRILKPLEEIGIHGVAMRDGGGIVRRIHPILAVFVGDYPEQVLVTGIKSMECPKCDVLGKSLGNAEVPARPRDIHIVLQALSKVNGDLRSFKNACKLARIKPISPFWQLLPFVDIFQAITPDILHQLHQGLLKRLFSWLADAYGADEINKRFQRLLPNHHVRIFTSGITELSRVTGKEHSLIACAILGVIADLQLPGGLDSTRLLRAVRALLDFAYLAQLPLITTPHLVLMQKALDMFHENKQIFVDLHIRKDFNLPKLHACIHYILSIQRFGTTDNYNTQQTERLHADYTKPAYRASNTRDEYPQMTTWLEQREKVHYHAKYIKWRHQDHQEPPSLSLNPHLTSQWYIKMTKFPSRRSVSIEDLMSAYGANLFHSAFSRFAVLWKNPQTTRTHLEQDILDVHIPFTTVSVYHRIRFRDKYLEEPTVNSIQIRPQRVDRKGRIIPGRFDTTLINCENGGRTRIHGMLLSTRRTGCFTERQPLAYHIGQVHVIFSINHTALTLVFGEQNHPPQHLAYVEWFTPFEANPEPKTGLYKISRSMQNDTRIVSIVPVASIAQSIHLSPLPGSCMPSDWTSDTVLEKCHKFLVNSFSDRNTYLRFHSPT